MGPLRAADKGSREGSEELGSVPHHAQTLLAEVVVDVGGLHRQVAGRVEGVALVLRRLVGGLTHSQ